MNYIQWCKDLFAMLKEGGEWYVPRSGLVFRKQAGALVLEQRLGGYESDWQDADYDCIKRHFADAGIGVRSHA